jgi:ribosomal-protein-alanine N-acetyltransferase
LNTIIRLMTIADVDSIVAMDRLILGQSLGEETYLLELQENQFTTYFIMEEAGEIIGHIGLWLDPPLSQVLNFYIIDAKRHHGYGSVLFEYALTYLQSVQVDTLTLEVRPSNQSAIKFYERFGFSVVATRKQYYSDSEDAYLMLKKL